jgi:hypothetical protein
MSRRGFVVLLLLLPAVLSAPIAAAGDPWKKARGEFLRAFDSNKPEERMRAIYDHLEDHDRPELVKLLVRVLAKEDEAAQVLNAAIDVLGDLTDEKAIEALAAACGKGPDHFRERALAALGRTNSEAGLARLREDLGDRSLRVRIAAAAAMGNKGDEDAVPPLGEALRSPDWPVRAAAAASLKKIESADALPHLILAIGREEGRLREDLRDALVKIGKTNQGLSFERWLRWFERKGEALEYERGSLVPDPVRPTVVYHGIPTWARKVVFVVDVSESMREVLRANLEKAIPEEIRRAGGEELERWKAMKTKIEWAQAHLEYTIETMAPDVEFGIVTYNHGTTPVFSGRLVPATPENRKSAITRVTSLSPSGTTNLLEALRRSLRIPNGRTELGANLLDGPGTIYFMTDGVSTEGAIRKGFRIFEEIDLLNRARRIRFHCVGVGEHDADLLGRLASSTGGSYVTFD